jgi:hypothetical protein
VDPKESVALVRLPVKSSSIDLFREERFLTENEMRKYDSMLPPPNRAFASAIVCVTVIASLAVVIGIGSLSRFQTGAGIGKLRNWLFYKSASQATDVDMPVGLDVSQGSDSDLVAKPIGDGDVVVQKAVPGYDPNIFAQKETETSASASDSPSTPSADGSPSSVSGDNSASTAAPPVGGTPVNGGGAPLVQENYGENTSVPDPNRKHIFYKHLGSQF